MCTNFNKNAVRTKSFPSFIYSFLTYYVHKISASSQQTSSEKSNPKTDTSIKCRNSIFLTNSLLLSYKDGS